jgi:formylglycine-generating enzyme required for sulfatase activity
MSPVLSRIWHWLLVLLCLCLCLCLCLPASAAAAERLALVIGNDRYQSTERLETARNDARDIAHALERFHFRVTVRLDQDEKGMREAVRNFKASVHAGDQVVFYFSGHGAQFDSGSYLLPVDIRGDDPEQVKDDSLPLQRVLDGLADREAGFVLAIVDACRNNPFQPLRTRHLGSSEVTRGSPTLPNIVVGGSSPSAVAGQMVVFSAANGQEALDRLDDNDPDPHGVFTRVLLHAMQQVGLPLDRILRQVRAEVVRLAHAAGHEQVPAVFDQTVGDFYFESPNPIPDTAMAADVSSVRLADERLPAEIDDDAWQSASREHAAVALRAYLTAFPRGRHAGEARWRLTLAISAHGQTKAPAPASLHAATGSAYRPDIKLAKARPPAPGQATPHPRTNTLSQGSRSSAPHVAPPRSPGPPRTARPIEAKLRFSPMRPRANSAGANRPDIGFSDCTACPVMVIVPIPQLPTFAAVRTSWDAAAPAEAANHAEPFAMSRSPVTQGQWRAVMGSNPSYFDQCGDDCPVERISWADVQTFISQINRLTGRHYRVPTAAEWDLACSAKSGRERCGADATDEPGWYLANSARTTHPVGQKRPNAHGLVDMTGNVEQWLNDCEPSAVTGAPATSAARSASKCAARQVRGTAWNLDRSYGVQSHLPPGTRSSMVGVRLVRSLD